MPDLDRNLQSRLRYALSQGKGHLVHKAVREGAQVAPAVDTFWDLASRAPTAEALDALALLGPPCADPVGGLTAAVEANRPANITWWRQRGTPWVHDPAHDSVLISALLAGHEGLLPWLVDQGAHFPPGLTWSPLVHALAHPASLAQRLIETAIGLGADPTQVSLATRDRGNVLQAWVARVQARATATSDEVAPLWRVLARWVDPHAEPVPGLSSAHHMVIAHWGLPDWLRAWDREVALNQRPATGVARERARS